VAVSEAGGDVYVVDSGNGRVEVFTPVAGGGYEYASQFKVFDPGAIAVDNSVSEADPTRGDVYVAGAEEKESGERDVVYEYSPAEGKVVHKWKRFKAKEKRGGEVIEEELELEDVSGLSVDASGTLWVYWEEEGDISGFGKAVTKGEGARLVWEPGLTRTPEIEGKFECSARAAFAVAPDREAFYVGYERESAEETCPGESGETADPVAVAKLDGLAPLPRTVTGELDHQNTTGVAVEAPGGDVYLDNEGSVAEFTSAGLLVQRFGSGELSGGSGIAVDAATGEVLVPELGEDEVAVFAAEDVSGPPVIDGASAQESAPESVRLTAQIDPRGAQSEYHFEYGTAACQASAAACVALPVGVVPAGFGDQGVSVTVSGLAPATAYYFRLVVSNVDGGVEGGPWSFATLPSASVLADGRAWELVSPADKHGAAVEVPSRSRGGSIQAAADGDGIVWLATGPVVGEPEGNRSFELTQLISTRGSQEWGTRSLETPHQAGRGLILPSPSEYHFFTPDLSESLVEPTEPAPGRVGGVIEHPPLSPEASEKTPYVRHDAPGAPAEFVPVVTPGDDTAHTAFGGGLEFLGASSDLRHVVLESKVGLSAQDPSSAGLYEWEAAGRSLALVSVLPDGAPAPDEQSESGSEDPVLGDGGGLDARNAVSSDGSRVFWSEERQQVPEALYMRDSETGETVQVSEAQGHGGTEPGTGGMSVPEPARQEVHFQTASSDGSRVFFTDTARLAEESGQEPAGEEPPADLYEFELTSSPGEPLRGRLTDLSADPTSGSGDVLNLIPGASSDGSSVYFVANGVLAPGATPGECERNPENEAEKSLPGATCNLYLEQYNTQSKEWEPPRFIAALSNEDAADWGADPPGNLPPSVGDLAAVTASVSPDGRYFAFMSQQSLTGYNNQDAQGGAPAQEVFLYDAAAGRVTCVSCNPASENGAFEAPEGVFDTELAGEGVGLLVDRPGIWRGHWLAGSIPGWTFNIFYGAPAALYQPRYLSDSGRLFFDTPEALVPADTNHKEDVYEYEPEGIGTCGYSAGCIGLISSGTSNEESTFLDASENGGDAFFLTSQQLVPQDSDHAYDIYDARVCSQASPCFSSPASSAEGCQSTATCRPGSASSPPQIAATASATYTGPGNPAGQGVLPTKSAAKARPKPLTRAEKLTLALKNCKKIKRRHSRKVCEAQARRKYGPTTKAKKGKPKPGKSARTASGSR
jgi:DNA-binding beta-propeller fold protein YncE